MSKLILKCDNLCKTYQDGKLNVNVLNNLSFELFEGEVN